ncbi:hypothetical protein [Glutamicibacter sp. AOP5-A2-18]|uniref:hypothetical protein n=1 Tax=Glutamicibacter sp. AOP5-A2-18 TaxID=3457656 RepID=UPI004034C000
MSEATPMQSQPEISPVKAKNKKKRWALILTSVLVVGSLIGGVFWGMNILDPKKSDEYLALAETVSTVTEQRDKAQADYADLDSGISEREDAADEKDTALNERATELDEREEELSDAEAEVAEREKAVGKIEAEQLENSVESGVWTVGTDIKAGTYRTKESVDSECYWAVLATGTNGSDIIDNGIPGGGRPTVSLKKGQDFETQRCGTWVKQ